MDKKSLIRKKFYNLRKNKYFQINENFFAPLFNLMKEIDNKNKINVSIYYPSSYEVNVLKILDSKHSSKYNFLLPIIGKKNDMIFCKWKKNDILNLNKFGILEPIKAGISIPKVVLVPLLAFDNNKYRLGYGKGFYDRYLNKLKKKKRNVISIGVAFSFQKYHKLPNNYLDYKLNYIITEKGLLKWIY